MYYILINKVDGLYTVKRRLHVTSNMTEDMSITEFYEG